MYRRLILTLVVAIATSSLASAQFFGGFYRGPVGGFGGGGGGSYNYGSYHSYYHYSAPSYNYAPAPQIVYHRVPIYVVRKKPTVKTYRVIKVAPTCGCDTAAPAAPLTFSPQ